MKKEHQSEGFSEALAAQEPFLARIARALVADSGVAQELVQETLMAAWARRDLVASKGRGDALLRDLAPGSLRGWLSSVLRRRAVSRRRRARGHEALDEATVSAEAILTPEFVAERVELQAVLAESITGLQDIYRDTIALRYQEELSVAEIAVLRGLTESTVRTRLSRGLSDLRAALDRRSGDRGGEGAAPLWLSAVTPLLIDDRSARAAVRSAAASASAPAGALVVKAVAATTLVLASVVAAVHLIAEEPPAAPADVIAEVPSSRSGVTQVAGAPLGEAPRRVAVASGEGGPGPGRTAAESYVRGRVVLEGGIAAPGVTVLGRPVDQEADAEATRAISGDDGSFELMFEDAEPGAAVALELDLGPGRSELVDRLDSVELAQLGDEGVEFVLRALLVRLAPVSGQPSPGESLEDASLLLTTPSVRASTAPWRQVHRMTRYFSDKWQVLPIGPAYTFFVAHGAFAADDLVAYLPAGSIPGRYELSLRPDVPELGSVTAIFQGADPEEGGYVLRLIPEDDRGVHSLSMKFASSPYRWSGRVPGRYRVEVEAWESAELQWSIPSLPRTAIEVAASEDCVVEIDLHEGGRCRLIVAAPDLRSGTELSGFMPLIRGVGEERWLLVSCRSDSPGERSELLPFPIAGERMVIDELLEPGSYELRLKGPQETTRTVSFDVLPGQFTEVNLEL